MKKVVIRLLILVLLGGGAYAAYKAYQSLPQREQSIATTVVRQGDVVVRSFTRGELRAVRSVTLTAPNLFGSVQVTRLAPLGSLAREKNLIVEFDDSEVRSRLEENQLEIDQLDEQIKKTQADLAMRNNQDQVELLSARFAVRRAELEVQRNELLAAIDAKKNLLTLEEARRRLKQLENDIKSRQVQAEAQIATLHEQRNKGLLELSREKQRLNQVKLLAPISGLVAVRQNRGNFMFAGMQVPDIREGDQIQPGIPVADVLDISEMELIGRVGELDRANLRDGQEVLIRLDAVADRQLHGKIKTMSGTASANPMSFDPAKRFDVVFAIDMRELLGALGAKPDQIQRILASADENRRRPLNAVASAPATRAPAPGPAGGEPQVLSTPSSQQQFSPAEMDSAKLPPPPEEESQLNALLRPGMLADVEIIVDRVPNALNLPMQAVFEKDGKPVVYVRKGNQFEARAIRPLKRSESTMIVSSGVKAGEVVALADPTAKQSKEKREKPQGGAMRALPGGTK